MYKNIIEYLGENWFLKEYQRAIKGLKVPEKIATNIANQLLGNIDTLIGKVKNVKGFSIWIDEVKTAEDVNIDNLMFELMCFENLVSEDFTLKVTNSEGKNLEGLIKTKQKEVYIEMVNMNEFNASPKNKVHKFFKKAKIKFTDKDGILFVNCGRFQSASDSSREIKLTPEILSIIQEIKNQFKHGENKRTDGIVLVVMTWFVNPEMNYKLFTDKRFIVLPKPKNKGGMSKWFLPSIISADEFLIE